MRRKTFSIKGLLTLGLLTTFFIASPSFAREPIRTVNGTVSIIYTGDTIQVTTPEHTQLRVHLYGIDAPEMEKYDRYTGRVDKPRQPYAKESKEALEGKILGTQVRVDIIKMQIRHPRHAIGIIWIGNMNINLEMVQEGYAEAYVEHLTEPYLSQFVQAEKEAKSAKKGIWSLRDYERPSDFRKRFKEAKWR
jgi:micrococcal nuclease